MPTISAPIIEMSREDTQALNRRDKCAITFRGADTESIIQGLFYKKCNNGDKSMAWVNTSVSGTTPLMYLPRFSSTSSKDICFGKISNENRRHGKQKPPSTLRTP